jgi:acyl-CoA hydrolase
VHVGDEVSVYADLMSVGRTSMKLQVEAWRRSRDGDEQVKVTEAVFTFVAIDSGARPRPIPPSGPGLQRESIDPLAQYEWNGATRSGTAGAWRDLELPTVQAQS